MSYRNAGSTEPCLEELELDARSESMGNIRSEL